jgi:hypothetical protein
MTEIYVPNPDVAVWRTAAVALCEYACNGAIGRRKDDPVYVEVTEHRDGPTDVARADYSSCGDLAWWLLYRLGLRKPWMNRAANGTYNNGMNVADLTGSPPHISAPSGATYTPKPGDILEIWNKPDTSDAHVCVALGPGAPGKLRIANFGLGGMSSRLTPGAGVSEPDYRPSTAGNYVGARRLRVVLPLERVVPLLTAPPDLSGAALTGDVLDALKATWTPPEGPVNA